MRTPPRWLREHRRVARAAASPESLAAEVAWRVEVGQGATTWKPPVPADWGKDRGTISDEEWEPFIAAIEEAKGRPLTG